MYLLAMGTEVEFEIKLRIVHRQLLRELTDRSSSKQQASRTSIRLSAQVEKYLALCSTKHKLSMILQQWRMKV